MMMDHLAVRPAAAPCRSCPYRRDVPSGVWDADEYAKLPRYDGETWEQSPCLFMCHQRDGHLCAGWVGCHDMAESLAFRLAAASGMLAGADLEAVLEYESPVPLFGSGAEAAAHGLADVLQPGKDAVAMATRLRRRLPQ